jgi:hypothetical protein
MQDTVTVDAGVTTRGSRPDEPIRSIQTTMRLERHAIARFSPPTPTDALLGVPGV